MILLDKISGRLGSPKSWKLGILLRSSDTLSKNQYA